MTRTRKAAKLAALAMAAASVWRLLRRERAAAPARKGAAHLPERSPARARNQPAWPGPVRNFVRLATERGARVRDVRIEERAGEAVWVVEWDGGRTLTFPTSSAKTGK